MTVNACLAWLLLSRTFALPESALSTYRYELEQSIRVATSSETSVAAFDDSSNDSCSLPWNVSRSAYRDVPDNLFPSLMLCPKNLHGCSEEVVNCHNPNDYVITCSCAPNYVVYGDCCWNVDELPETPIAEMPRTSCVSVHAKAKPTEQQLENDTEIGTLSPYPHYFWKVHLRVVVGCPASWTDKDVRKACKEHESFKEVFHSISTTKSRRVTYRNGFCALCNNDSVDGVFWDSMSDEYGTTFLLPDTVNTKAAHHRRPCSDDIAIDTCHRDASEEVSRKCKTYYGPVQDSRDGTVYKNVYCAACNGADVSKLTCTAKVHFYVGGRFNAAVPGRGFAALFKLVTTTTTCRAFFNGRCYIPSNSNVRDPDLIASDGDDDDWPPEESGARSYATPAWLCFTLCLGVNILDAKQLFDSRV